MQDTKLLYLIIEFEQDLRSYLYRNVVEKFDKEDTLAMFKEKIKKRRNLRHDNLEKIDFDLLTMGELGEFISYNKNNFAPELLSNISEFRDAVQFLVQIRNDLAHPYSVDDDFEQNDLSIKLKVYESINFFQKSIDDFPWTKTIDAFEVLSDEKNFNIKIDDILKKISFPILHNLPEPQHKDTTLIGRKDELNRLNKYMSSNRGTLISICGPGGLGKTALALEYCHQLVTSEDAQFSRIVFFSFKEEDLLDDKFSNSSLKSFDGLVDIVEDDFSYQSNNISQVIDFLDSEGTLIVIDNTESLSKEEILEFYWKFENAKILITSRIGLGEVEIRIDLQPLEFKESRYLFRQLANIEDVVDVLSLHDEDIDSIIKQLQTPLGLKWFFRLLTQGLTVDEILEKTDDLIEFCTRGIFKGLTKNDLKTISCLYDSSKSMSIGEMSFYTNVSIAETETSIHNLNKRSLIYKKRERKKLDEKYYVVDQAISYIDRNLNDFNIYLEEIYKLKKQVKAQDERLYREARFSENISINKFYNIEDHKISSSYLIQALNEAGYTEKAKVLIETAKQVDNNYSEIYKVSAFLKSHSGLISSATKDYERSVAIAQDDEEKAIMSFWYAGFLLRFNTDNVFESADKLIEMSEFASEKLNKIQSTLQHARILSALGSRKKAIDVVENLNLDFNDIELFYNRANRKVLSSLTELRRLYYLEELKKEGLLELAVEKFDDYLNETIEIFATIKNDNKLTASIFKYFYEITLGVTYLSNEFSNEVLSRIFENMKRVKIYKIDQELNQLIDSLKIVIQKLSKESLSNLIERKVIVEDYFSFISQTIDSREEEIVDGLGYFSGFSKGQVYSLLTHEKMNFPTQIYGTFHLSEEISFGDKVSAKVNYVQNSRSYLESLELVEKADLSRPRILEIASQPDDSEKFLIRDFKTNWFLLFLTREELQNNLKINLEVLGATTKGSIYVEGYVENVGKRVPVPTLESLKEIYSVKEINQFNYLIKLNHLYSTVDEVKENIKSVREKLKQFKLNQKLLSKKLTNSYSISNGVLINTSYNEAKISRGEEFNLKIIEIDAEKSLVRGVQEET